MTDDIVARLRSTGGLDARLLCEAADEIERLRLRNLQLERAISASEFLLRQTQEATDGRR